MTASALEFIKNQLANAGVNYEFGRWTSDIVYPYFVGEYTETPTDSEDGRQEINFILNGFSRGTWADFETARAAIEQQFTYNTMLLSDGTGIDVCYENSRIIPQDNAELKRIEINLTITLWRVI